MKRGTTRKKILAAETPLKQEVAIHGRQLTDLERWSIHFIYGYEQYAAKAAWALEVPALEASEAFLQCLARGDFEALRALAKFLEGRPGKELPRDPKRSKLLFLSAVAKDTGRRLTKKRIAEVMNHYGDMRPLEKMLREVDYPKGVK